jgi:predicted RNA-binding protein with PIN domain
MSLHIIVDGYNLIRQSTTFSALEDVTLQEGRDALVESLIAYRRVKRHPITVVFDGTRSEVNLQAAVTQRGGITVMFSRQGELADTVIKGLVSREGQRAVVVSSDNEIVDYAEQRGVATIGARQFEAKMKAALLMDSSATAPEPVDTNEWKPTTKKKGPARRRSKRDRKRKVKTRKL